MASDRKENNYDVIVIGSGLGGISTAGFLSRINKKKVLVLERHFEPGGLTHEFKRGPYSWDVGLHYINDMSKRLLDHLGLFFFRFLTNDKLKWNKTANPFERFVLPGFTLEINEGVNAYKKTLIKQFPQHKKSIKKYIRDVYLVRIWYLCDFFSKFLYPPFSTLFKLLRLINIKLALMTTYDYLAKNIKDEKLRAVLTIRWGNYGVPPKESAFAIHALIEHHYYNGSMFPRGGAEKICTYIEEAIDENGGCILINREVTEVILENNRAVGVRVCNLADPDNSITEYYAPVVISSAGLKNTYLNLLPQTLNLPIQKKLVNFFPGYSAINIYLGLNDSPEKLGIKGENIWITIQDDCYNFNKNFNSFEDFKPDYSFLSFPSLKSGSKKGFTAEIVSIIPYDFVKNWEESGWKNHSNDYYQLKELLINKYLDFIEKKVPGFRQLIVYKEMATPLTFKHFTNRSGGAFYGLPAVPERYKLENVNVKTPIKGLYLTGTDIISNGIMPALFSGMATASYLGGPIGILNIIQKSLFYRPVKQKNQKDFMAQSILNVNSEDKLTARLIEKKQIFNNTLELTYRFEKNFNFIPGQHIKLLVGDGEWRAYSIARSNGSLLTLIIDTRPDGYGTRYVKKIRINDLSLFRLPLSDLTYHESTRDLMFIATGTGFVPFIHILDELKKQQVKRKVIILFGCLTDEDNFIDDYIKPYEDFFSIEKYICVENPLKDSTYFHGRVTDLINSKTFSLTDFDIYICGHPHMTEAVCKLLRTKGSDRIYW